MVTSSAFFTKISDKKSVREAKARKREQVKLKKRKLDDNENLVESPSHDQICAEGDEPNKVEREKGKDKLTKKKKRKKEKRSKSHAAKSYEDENNSANPKCTGEGDSSCTPDSCQTETQNKITNNTKAPKEANMGIDIKTSDRSKKSSKDKKIDQLSSKKSRKLKGKTDTVDPDEVYYISSEDEDCSKGMKKWIMEYHQSRPGLKILQQRIDEFTTAHEAQEEQARKEREAQAAEGGWTVVVHHKGRKKTTDSESGITVGAVAQAAVVDKMSKKKSKEVGIDFYRFQRREAQRNEIMMLQSKFEQDRKRIQQLRAARKFRPY
ncbi:glutamic acid-rich protein [Macadamia integrifolia]|uniref:glutamic acid-rich protein n=1 Tax=Macadamia integrifolia TaxID=60698 RepID=UPI001C4F0049|nr:glutamic acid-rich protein [Macadamia integrifolia]